VLANQTILTDLNGDGKLDLVLQGTSSGGALVYVGDGAGAFTLQAELADPLGFPGLVMVADLNGDGILDVATLASDTLTIFLGEGGFNFAPEFSIGTGPAPSGLLAANLHGQPSTAGLPDIVVPDASFGAMVLLNQTK
jgi:hypothetical protein